MIDVERFVEEFSEEEIALLMQRVTLDHLPTATVRKLKKLDLIKRLDSLPRNLGIFFQEIIRITDTEKGVLRRTSLSVSSSCLQAILPLLIRH